MYKDDFHLTSGCYLLNHSVGRALKTGHDDFNAHFFAPWQSTNKEPWQQWLGTIERFTGALRELFNSKKELFCQQVNLSSALTKILMSHPRFTGTKCRVLMAQSDFPSMGFAMQKALPDGAHIDYIPHDLDLTDITIWQQYIKPDTDLVFISHAYSNTGQQAPVKEIAAYCRRNNTLSLVDVAQSAGVLPLDLSTVGVDFLIGSSVKWLCSGPGAAYLWVSESQLGVCQPKDVGWFSHENPFEFDIHHFKSTQSAMKFWGGTPSIAPYAFAAHSIGYVATMGVDKVNQHNRKLQALLIEAFRTEMVSPLEEAKRSGTVILNFDDNHAVLKKLEANAIAVDARSAGLRISPHIYNDEADIDKLISVLK